MERSIGWKPPFRIATDPDAAEWVIYDSSDQVVVRMFDVRLNDLTERWDIANDIAAQLNENFPKPKPRKICPECQGYGEPDPGHPCSRPCRKCGGSGWIETSLPTP